MRRCQWVPYITDSNLSPLARLADVAQAEVKGFRGLTSSLCLVQTLAISLGVRQDKAQEKAAEEGASTAT